MKTEEVRVQVTDGKYCGTIGRVASVKRIHFERHEYMVMVDTKTIKFCGSKLAEAGFLEEPTLLFDPDPKKDYFDCNERMLEVGQTVICATYKGMMRLGTIRSINGQGVFVRIFMQNGAYGIEDNDMRLHNPTTSMVIDRNTVHAIMIQKMSCGSIDITA